MLFMLYPVSHSSVILLLSQEEDCIVVLRLTTAVACPPVAVESMVSHEGHTYEPEPLIRHRQAWEVTGDDVS